MRYGARVIVSDRVYAPRVCTGTDVWGRLEFYQEQFVAGCPIKAMVGYHANQNYDVVIGDRLRELILQIYGLKNDLGGMPDMKFLRCVELVSGSLQSYGEFVLAELHRRGLGQTGRTPNH